MIFSYSALLVPNELLGRVTSAAMTLSWGVMPTGSLGTGLLLTTAGPTGAILVLIDIMLATATATAIAATVSPAVRHAPTAAHRKRDPASRRPVTRETAR